MVVALSENHSLALHPLSSPGFDSSGENPENGADPGDTV